MLKVPGSMAARMVQYPDATEACQLHSCRNSKLIACAKLCWHIIAYIKRCCATLQDGEVVFALEIPPMLPVLQQPLTSTQRCFLNTCVGLQFRVGLCAN